MSVFVRGSEARRERPSTRDEDFFAPQMADSRPATQLQSRVLVVEDNPDLAYGLRNSLEIAGYDVVVAEDGVAGVTQAREIDPDLIVLDLMLPGMDGYRVLRTLRDEGRAVPVLILTARGEEADKVLGFRMGADDYVTKPFGVLELLARIEALIRRTRNWRGAPSAPATPTIEQFGDIEVDVGARTVKRGKERIELTPKEFDLLLALLQRQGRVSSRNELLRAVWGYSASVVSRTVDTHVAELRRKLEHDAAEPRHILTVWKVGYKFQR
jgi:two-component system, OmpR family, alkaline phosphatase synthesis response regulator PhoP